MTRDGFAIRPAAKEDLGEILQIERAAAEAPHWKAEEYEGILQAGEGRIERCLLVAVAGGGVIREEQIVGFAVGALTQGTDEAESWGELESLAVMAKQRRRGAGRALCEAVVRWCERQGAGSIDLEVRAGSTGAQVLYGGLGFAEVGRRRGYYHDPPEDAVLMRRKVWTWEMRGRSDGCGAG